MKPPKLKAIPSKVERPQEKISKPDNSYNPQPSLNLNEQILPEITDWKIGKTYTLTVEVKMTGIRHSEYGHDKGKASADFKITKIASHD